MSASAPVQVELLLSWLVKERGFGQCILVPVCWSLISVRDGTGRRWVPVGFIFGEDLALGVVADDPFVDEATNVELGGSEGCVWHVGLMGRVNPER
jgi:hypothetical protein